MDLDQLPDLRGTHPIRDWNSGQNMDIFITDWYTTSTQHLNLESSDSDDPDAHDSTDRSKFIIKIFGLDAVGRSISLNIEDFQPFFFIKIPDTWRQTHVDGFLRELKKQVYFKLRNCLVSHQIIRAKPFYMFTGHDKTNFLKLVFSNREAFDNYRRKIQTGGNEQQFPQRETQFPLYEANIDPMLRMIHLRDLAPSGWIRLRGGTYTVNSMATATTQLDLTCKWTDVTQL